MIEQIKNIIGDIKVSQDCGANKAENMAVRVVINKGGDQVRLDKILAKGKTTMPKIIAYCESLVVKAGRKLHSFPTRNKANDFAVNNNCGQVWDDLSEGDNPYHVYEY